MRNVHEILAALAMAIVVMYVLWSFSILGQ